ncbi:MAG: hypothetical protein AAFQ58_07000 [Pseudomonadota bacterium]
MGYACVYPTALRSANTLLLDILDAGGAVSVHHRAKLGRTLSHMDPVVVIATLTQDVPRRDARAAQVVLDVVGRLANGRGLRVEEAMRPHLNRLDAAADDACSGTTDVAAGPDAAQGAEQGKGRQTGQGGRALTFREGVVRLSVTFTTYLIFLAFLLGLRREWRARRARLDIPKATDPPREPGAPQRP